MSDPAYEARRAEIARISASWTPGTPAPTIDYTETEHEVWRTLCRELRPLHQRFAHSSYLEAWDRAALPTDRVPQLEEVSAAVGFRFLPAPGLVPLRTFYSALADRTFHSTQYLRHPDTPLYTPEPDLAHEVVGHGVCLAAPPLAELHRLTGEAARRCETDAELQFLARVFWYTAEFGVAREDGELKAYGAGLLSSYGELGHFRNAEIRPLDFEAMGTAVYDISEYQPVLYLTEDLDEVYAFLEGYAHKDRLGV